MNATAIETTLRAIGLAVTVAVAVALGLALGSAMQGQAGGGAGPAAPRTASAALSLDAIAALQAIRDETAVTAAADYVDYGLRHQDAEAETSESATTPTPR